jgi:NifU-like protein involved in Fe-S cluster formation
MAVGRLIAPLPATPSEPYIHTMFDDLYNGRVLELAADIPNVGRLAQPTGTSTKVSKLCGSVVTVDVVVENGTVMAIAVDPKACALGQASTAVLAGAAVGATIDDLVKARDALKAMLKDGAAPPEGRFWELRYLEGVREYPPRHASTLLAFEAAVEAAT